MPASASALPVTSSRRRASRKSQLPRLPPAPPIANVFSWDSKNRTRFVELVALQSLFSRAPCDAAEHTTKLKEWEIDTDKQSGWRLLPGKTEREAADHFAFLAAADSGSEYCAAACIEGRKGGGLLFRLAMNEGVLNEGVPKRILDGLKGVCKELEVATIEGRNERKSREVVWQRVLDLELRKVTKDLRQKFKRASKKSLPELFREALDQKKQLSCDSRMPSDVSLHSIATSQASSVLLDARAMLEKIYDQCRDVVNRDCSSNCRDEVERLLDTCYMARRSRSFRKLMSSIEVRKQLMQTIEKLGRYKASSYALASLAHRYPEAFRTIEIQTVSPPVRESFALPENLETGLATIASNLACNSVEEANQQLKALTGLSAPKLLSKYEELYLGRPHIHAEIQLVKFYEENPSVDPPKFIGTSKKACYLCNIFLDLHGRFAVSKSHQNLYPRWTVPTIVCSSSIDVERYNDVVKRMSSLLETSCTKFLRQKDNTAGTIGRHLPNTSSHSITTPLAAGRIPVLASQLLSSVNSSLRSQGTLSKPRSTARPGKENISGTVTPRSRTRQSTPGIPTAVSHQSMKKVQDWTVSRPQSPEQIPLPPSVLSSRAPSPVPSSRAPTVIGGSLLAALRAPLSPLDKLGSLLSQSNKVGDVACQPEEVGGVSLQPQPLTPAPKKKPSRHHSVAVQDSTPPITNKKLRGSRSKEGRRSSAATSGLTTVDGSLAAPSPSVEGPATGIASMEVQITKGRSSSSSPQPTTPKEVQGLSPVASTPKSSRSKARSSEPSTPTSSYSTETATTTTTATTATTATTTTSASTTPDTREKRRISKGKSRTTSGATTRPRPGLGALNLTIERHASPPNSPVGPETAHWLDSPKLAQDTIGPETEYTIYLAGNYSQGLSVGDAVFSGKLSDVNKKGEMMQCKGFRLRSGLRKRKVEGKAGVGRGRKLSRETGPLRVHEVIKTSEMMVLDIIFPDAVVRMEVFWDEEARSALM